MLLTYHPQSLKVIGFLMWLCSDYLLIITAEWFGGSGARQCCYEVTSRRSRTGDRDAQCDLGSQWWWWTFAYWQHYCPGAAALYSCTIHACSLLICDIASTVTSCIFTWCPFSVFKTFIHHFDWAVIFLLKFSQSANLLSFLSTKFSEMRDAFYE